MTVMIEAPHRVVLPIKISGCSNDDQLDVQLTFPLPLGETNVYTLNFIIKYANHAYIANLGYFFLL